jgi:hypothetical protein
MSRIIPPFAEKSQASIRVRAVCTLIADGTEHL